jgi:tRNA threonylcarbamoyl adenosine modification protein (Sua5/YciO/YrdC/YwlC family)
MIEYLIERNPDDRILNRASQLVRNGGLVTLPTETNWVICASPFSEEGLDKLYQLRKVDRHKHFTLLCNSFKKAMEIAVIDDAAYALMKKIVPGPYTFIFEPQKKISKFLKASKMDHEVGVRFSPSVLLQKWLLNFDDVLICTHLNHEMLGEEDDSIPIYGALIEETFAGVIDLVMDPGEYHFLGPSTVVDWTSGVPEVIREGAGSTQLFQR